MLADLEVLVIDCQTTGATPKHGELLEIGWARAVARHEALTVASHLLALPEGTHIPRAVARITGVSRDDLNDGIAPEVAWHQLCEAASDLGGRAAATVIHYARFETTWLRHLHERHAAGTPFPFDILCTHAIARRLHPDLPRRSLRAIAGYYGFDVTQLRRATGHVEATAHVWRHVVGELAALGVDRWDQLATWLSEARTPSSKHRAYPLARNKRLAIPDRPGIYFLKRIGGDVLYVGKAISLKRRVNSYFTKQKGYGERTLEMLSQTRDVEVIETPTALEASLLETDAIKRHRPPYNVHLLEDTRDVWFASRDVTQLETTPSDRCHVGPLPSRHAMASLAALCAALVGAALAGPASWRIRATAVGAAPAFAPDEDVFRLGLTTFRHQYLGREALDRDPVRELMALGKRLWRMQREGVLSLDADRDEHDPSWDPPRVARHLARAVSQCGQLVRRARWLCLLSDATIAFREQLDEPRRLLVIEGAEIVARGYLDEGAPLPQPAARSARERQQRFDIQRYDRLRVLSTELKRVMGQSGAAAVRTGPRGLLFGNALAVALDWV